MASKKLSANDLAHKNIEDKLDRLIITTDKVAESVNKHAETLARQDVTLDEHVRRTALLEVQVTKIDCFRNKVTAIAAFTVALSTLIIAALKLWM